jgi:3-phytase
MRSDGRHQTSEEDRMTTSTHRIRARRLLPAAALLAAGVTAAALLTPPPAVAKQSQTVRFSTFNASLNRAAAGALVTDLSTPNNVQASNVAETIQRVRPDVLLINEFDFDAQGTALRLFQDNYLSVPHNGAAPITYPHRYTAPSNTGVPSGHDLDNNGTVGGGNDAFGFGDFPGQFGMAVYSKFPIDAEHVRTFQHFLWKDMPGAKLPDDPATTAPADWYSPAELAVFRLSSKSHWDVPIRIGHRAVHFLVSHPTPPVFDGPEDRNGLRNHDEIRFWADYVRHGKSRYVYDDEGRRGGLAKGASFVIAGDQNSDPLDGDSVPGSAQLLLDNPRVNAKDAPTSQGAVEAAALQGGVNATHRSDPAFDTADFCDTAAPPPCAGPGNLRADYVLPSKDLRIQAGGVFWPVRADPLSRLTGPGFPVPTSDHRQVWVDVRLHGHGGHSHGHHR